MEEKRSPLEEAVDKAKEVQQQEFARKLLGYLHNGDMPYSFYKSLPESTKKAYRTKWSGLGKHLGHVKGRPMTPDEKAAYQKDHTKKKRKRKLAKASRKRNR